MYCKMCGKKLDDNAVFCQFCGVRVAAVHLRPDEKQIATESETSPEQSSIPEPNSIQEQISEDPIEINQGNEHEDNAPSNLASDLVNSEDSEVVVETPDHAAMKENESLNDSNEENHSELEATSKEINDTTQEQIPNTAENNSITELNMSNHSQSVNEAAVSVSLEHGEEKSTDTQVHNEAKYSATEVEETRWDKIVDYGQIAANKGKQTFDKLMNEMVDENPDPNGPPKPYLQKVLEFISLIIGFVVVIILYHHFGREQGWVMLKNLSRYSLESWIKGLLGYIYCAMLLAPLDALSKIICTFVYRYAKLPTNSNAALIWHCMMSAFSVVIGYAAIHNPYPGLVMIIANTLICLWIQKIIKRADAIPETSGASPQTLRCGQCGASLVAGVKFCSQCAAPVKNIEGQPVSVQPQNSNHANTAFMCAILGLPLILLCGSGLILGPFAIFFADAAVKNGENNRKKFMVGLFVGAAETYVLLLGAFIFGLVILGNPR